MRQNSNAIVTGIRHSRHNLRLCLAIIVLLCCAVTVFAEAGVERSFEAALYREVAVGDLPDAIAQYRALLSQSAADRQVSAKALLRIGLCQEKLGQRKEAYATYSRVVSEYPDQTDTLRKAKLKLAAWSGPRNLKFEEGIAGKAPPGWVIPSLPKDADYLAELRRDQCRSRSGCAVVLAPGNVPNATGNLMQSFSAAAYAGKVVRLRAWLRVESLFVSPALGLRLPSQEDRAQLWLTVERTNRRKGFSENTDDRPVRSKDWTRAEIIGEVDKDAAFINFGILSIGGARVWVDDVSFEVISSADATAAK
jgi:tetratricopeptide (TPR) repeat protein